MQTMDLRFEQMVNTVQTVQPEKIHGLNSFSQNDSSFETALVNAQQEIERAENNQKIQETAVDNSERLTTTDGNNLGKTEEVSLKDLNYLNASLEDVLQSGAAENLEQAENILAELKSFQFELDEVASSSTSEFEEQNGVSIEMVMDLIDKNSLQDNLSEMIEDEISLDSEIQSKTKNQKKVDSDLIFYSQLNPQVQNDAEIVSENPAENENFSVGKSGKIAKSENKPVISVIDERNFDSEPKTADNFVTKIEKSDNGEVQMTMNLNTSSSIEFEGVVQNGAEAKGMENFSQMLSQQIQTNAQDFVKAGNLILKDDNKGTINLVLHPEDLGNVRIQLEMTDKVIAGKIIVATKEAYDAFNENMNSLRDAFVESGFETGNFDLSWSGQQETESESNQRNFYGTVYENNLAEVDVENEWVYDSLLYGSSIVNVVV